MNNANTTQPALRGLALLNDGRYSFSVDGNEMRMIVARSVLYADHGGIRRDGEEYDYLDQGIQHFSYALKPFAGETLTAAPRIPFACHGGETDFLEIRETADAALSICNAKD